MINKDSAIFIDAKAKGFVRMFMVVYSNKFTFGGDSPLFIKGGSYEEFINELSDLLTIDRLIIFFNKFKINFDISVRGGGVRWQSRHTKRAFGNTRLKNSYISMGESDDYIEAMKSMVLDTILYFERDIISIGVDIVKDNATDENIKFLTEMEILASNHDDKASFEKNPYGVISVLHSKESLAHFYRLKSFQEYFNAELELAKKMN